MKFFITSGTHDFMKQIYLKNKQKPLYLLTNQAETLLVQESETKSIFSSPRSYQVLSSAGALAQTGVVLISYVYLDEEDRPVIEEKVNAFTQQHFQKQGLTAYRFLRPRNVDSYVIYTQWQDLASAKGWDDLADLLPKQSFLHHANPFTSQFYTKEYLAPSKIED